MLLLLMIPHSPFWSVSLVRSFPFLRVSFISLSFLAIGFEWLIFFFLSEQKKKWSFQQWKRSFKANNMAKQEVVGQPANNMEDHPVVGARFQLHVGVCHSSQRLQCWDHYLGTSPNHPHPYIASQTRGATYADWCGKRIMGESKNNLSAIRARVEKALEGSKSQSESFCHALTRRSTRDNRFVSLNES